MWHIDTIVRGLLAGLAISAPVGPVNVLCISNTLTKGRKSGLVSGLGAAAADTLYGSIAGFSISIVIGFLIRELFWIRLVGGALLIVIGFAYYHKKPAPLNKTRSEASHSDFAAAFLLNLTNPTTILSFLAVLAALGLQHHEEWWVTLLAVGGIFIGGMSWWIALVLVSNQFRRRVNDTTMLWMNRIAGLAIGAFGLFTLILSHGTRR